MLVLKRKQIVALSLIMMIVIAGFLQSDYNKRSQSVSKTTIEDLDEPRLGEAVYVDNGFVVEGTDNGDKNKTDKTNTGGALKDEKNKDDKIKDENSKGEKDSKKNVLQASKEANDFFAQAKMNRDIVRGKDTETLKDIAQSAQINEDMKADASAQMIKIVANSDKEMRIESLLKEKGFSDAVVLFADDGSLDIVIKAPSLSDLEIAQITDIASRQANTDINNIYIRKEF